MGANGAVKAALGMGAYAASKAGVHRLTEALAEELKADGVTVNAVLPSIIDTPTNRADMPKADFAAWVTPAELAAVMLFLASEKASAVTGALIPVTGLRQARQELPRRRAPRRSDPAQEEAAPPLVPRRRGVSAAEVSQARASVSLRGQLP